MKYSKKRAEQLCELIATGKHSIDDCCEMCDISRAVFYHWKKVHIDFLDMVEQAEAQRFSVISERAISGMYKLVDIYEYNEVKTEYEPADPKNPEAKPKVVSQTITKRKIMPSKAMIEYVLNNLRSDKFKTRNQTDHTDNGQSFSFGAFLQGVNTVPDEEIPADEQPADAE